MIPIIIAIVGISTVAPAPADFYQSRYDHIDIESILNNRRMINYYAACLLSQGPCTPQGTELKKALPEALESNCAKCTEKQKTAAYRVIKRLKKEYPKIWVQLHDVWDPDDKYVPRFEESFENQNSVAPAVPQLFNRFGETEDPDSSSNVAITSPPSSSSTTTTTTTTTTSTVRTTLTTKPTNKPVTNKPIYAAKPPQTPPFTTVGANLQATVTFMAALKSIVIQLYQHKLEVISRILSGR